MRRSKALSGRLFLQFYEQLCVRVTATVNYGRRTSRSG